jgi:hypothetical protein
MEEEEGEEKSNWRLSRLFKEVWFVYVRLAGLGSR